MSQLDKLCPIIKGNCSRNCTFYQRVDGMGDDYCQLSEFIKNSTPSKKSKAKPLLEGSDKKV